MNAADGDRSWLSRSLWAVLRIWVVGIFVCVAVTSYAYYVGVPAPDPATGRIYAMQDHGGYLYVTKTLIWFYDGGFVMAGILLVVALAIWFIAKTREM